MSSSSSNNQTNLPLEDISNVLKRKRDTDEEITGCGQRPPQPNPVSEPEPTSEPTIQELDDDDDDMVDGDIRSNKILLNTDLDKCIFLEVKSHVYTYKHDGKSTLLQSVTSCLSDLLYDRFDAKASSQRPQTHLRGITENISKVDRPEAVQVQWEFTRQVGTSFHEIIDSHLSQVKTDTNERNIIKKVSDNIQSIAGDFNVLENMDVKSEDVKEYASNTYDIEEFFDELHTKYDVFQRIYKNFFSHYEFLASEYMIYDPIHKLAGTVDALFWADKAKRQVIIVDWKTCANFSVYGVKVKNQQSPFFGQFKSKMDRYMCQLHLYTHILEKYYKVKVVQGYIVCFGKNDQAAIYDFNILGHANCLCKKTIFTHDYLN